MKKDKKTQEEIEETIEDNLETEVAEEHLLEKEEENNEIEELRTENRKLKEEFLRAYADAENTKKRCLQEIEKNNKYAISSFAKELLAVADNLDRAMLAATNKNDSFFKGIEMTKAELLKAFEKNGIHKMDIVGSIFDPNFHQAIQEIEDKKSAPGTIISELQTGYMINDRILREAMVVVTKK